MSCGLPWETHSRWIILPGDPEPLKRLLRRKRAEESGEDTDDLPPEPPSEEDL